MQDKLFRKCLVIGIIMLFIGAGFLPTISGTKELKTTNDNEFVEYIRFDDFEDYYIGEPPKASRGWSTSGETQNQYIEARVDPLDPSNMVMLLHGSGADPDKYCYIRQDDFGPASPYAVHYRIYTPELSMAKTVYEKLIEGNTELVNIHRRYGEIRWGHDSLYPFVPPIAPSTTRWIEEEVRATPDELRIWHDNSVDALGGYNIYPVNGIDSWVMGGYRKETQNFYIDDFWITVYSRPPDTPQRPSGPAKGNAGTKYTYTTYTYDPDDDQVYYKWEWGDGTNSSWIGPHDSGEIATAKHSWSEGSYSIRVKAKDDFEYESDWSAPLEVTMPRNRALTSSLFLRFLEQFPILQQILQRLGL